MSVIREILNSTKLLLNNSLPTTGSNTFVGTQTFSGSLIPATDNTYDLGSITKQFRDLYLSSASLYIDGNKVISSNTDTLTFTTDVGQNIKILETGGDDITLQTDTGNIELKGIVEIESGKKIVDSGATKVLFGDSVGITGSIDLTGTVDGVDISVFKTSFDTLEGKTLVSGSSQVSFTSITDVPIDLVSGSVLRTLDGTGVVSGSSQVTISSTNGFTSFSSSIDTSIQTEKGRIDAILSASDADKDSFAEIVTLINSVDTTNDNAFASFYTASNDRFESIELFTSSIDTTIKTKLNTDGVISGSSQVDYTQLQNIPSGIVSGSSQVSFNGIVDKPSLISGSDQITTLTSYTETFTSQTAVTASHNLGTKNVTVQVYGSDDFMIFPTSIKTHDTNNVYVQFNTSRSGRIVITK